MPYDIQEHIHRFAAWAASTAARSSKLARFPVRDGKAILESAGFSREFLLRPLPDSCDMDRAHQVWRRLVIEHARDGGYDFSHGVAAKLINVYLKAACIDVPRSVAGGIEALHPPFDSLLLDGLIENDKPRSKVWRRLKNRRWSKWTSDDYEQAITLARAERGERPLWSIEEHWRGYQ